MMLFEQIRDGLLSLIVASTASKSAVGVAAPVKAIAFFISWAVLWLPIAIPLAILLRWRPPQPLTPQQKLPLLGSLYLLAPLIVWGASSVEGVSFSDYGVQTSHLEFIVLSLGLGVGLAILGLALVFAIEVRLGWADWHQENIGRLGSIFLPVLLLGLWIGGTEELVFRGFLFNELQRDYSTWLAAAIASLIFAILHLVWELNETLPQIPGLWLMGMILTLARWVDGGSLALAWGLHAGWIWGLTCLDTAQLISYTDKSPNWITGIAAKPLAGIMGILCLVGTGLVILALSPNA